MSVRAQQDRHTPYDGLIKLAQALDVDLANLADDCPAPTRPVVGRRSVAFAGDWTEARSARHSHFYPAAEIRNKLMTPIIVEVTARSVAEMGGFLRHSGEEYLYVLTGRMELHSELFEPLALAAGDSVYFDSAMPHAYVKLGAEPCRALTVCAGPGLRRLVKSVA